MTKVESSGAVKELGDRHPVYIRAPRHGNPERFTGLSRAYLFRLAKLGHVRSVSVTEPGKKRGVRLFHLPSLLAFIASCETAAR